MSAEPSVASVRWTSWLRWLGLTLAGLLGGLVVFFAVGVTMGEMLDELFPEFVFGLVLGAIFGTAFGLAHWLFLRRYISGIGAWVPATIIGFALGAAIVFGPLNTQDTDPSMLVRISHATSVGLSLGLMQWLVLRGRLFHHSYLWMVISVGAWIAGELAGTFLANLRVEEPIPLLTIFLIGASLSGIGMIWLLKEQALRPSGLASLS